MPESELRLGPIPKSVVERFRAVLSLPEDKLRKINEWAKAHLHLIVSEKFDAGEIESASASTGVRKSELMFAVSLLGTMMLAGDAPGTIQLDDLEELGLGDLADKAKLLLSGISVPAQDAEYTRQKGVALSSVVPTLDSVDVTCELRAIFGRFPSPSRSEAHESKVKELLGFEPVALVSVELNDAVGNDSSCVFQVTETGLRSLLKTFQEAVAQIEIIKDAQKKIGRLQELS